MVESCPDNEHPEIVRLTHFLQLAFAAFVAVVTGSASPLYVSLTVCALAVIMGGPALSRRTRCCRLLTLREANGKLQGGIALTLIGLLGLFTRHALMGLMWILLGVGLYRTAAAACRNIRTSTPRVFGMKWEVGGSSFSVWYRLGNLVASREGFYRWFMKDY